MATYTVTEVRKELSDDGTHKHIEGVCTSDGTHYTRKEVVDSIEAGNTWKTKAAGYEATIKKISYCPQTGCLASPYIETKRDSTKKDNLENLDLC
ncbi:MAG TPA: DUF3892 domain-containing protein [Solirubrobacteraceae bacterium]